MKKIIAAAAMLAAMAISCRNNEVRQQILTGDLLFVGIPVDYQADNMRAGRLIISTPQCSKSTASAQYG